MRGHEGAILNGGQTKQELKNPSCELSQRGQQHEWCVCACVYVCFNVFVVVRGGMFDTAEFLGVIMQHNCIAVIYETLGVDV